MKVTKIGHCCFVIEEKGVKLLTDPGAFTVAQNDLTGVDAVLITHEHPDHYHVESIKKILKNNPQAIVVTNASVGALLQKEGIAHTQVGENETTEVKGIKIEGFGHDHAPIYSTYGRVENTGYLIGSRLYFPGDALHNPGRPIELLGLPVYGPWMKISEVIDYALTLKPRAAFSMHDAPVKQGMNFGARVAENFLTQNGIEFVAMGEGDVKEF